MGGKCSMKGWISKQSIVALNCLVLYLKFRASPVPSCPKLPTTANSSYIQSLALNNYLENFVMYIVSAIQLTFIMMLYHYILNY